MWISMEESKGILKAQGKSVFTRHAHTHFLSDTEERLTVLPKHELFKWRALSSMLLVFHVLEEMPVWDFSALWRKPNVFEQCSRLGLVPIMPGGKREKGCPGESCTAPWTRLSVLLTLTGLMQTWLLRLVHSHQRRAGRTLQRATCCHF